MLSKCLSVAQLCSSLRSLISALQNAISFRVWFSRHLGWQLDYSLPSGTLVTVTPMGMTKLDQLPHEIFTMIAAKLSVREFYAMSLCSSALKRLCNMSCNVEHHK